MHIMVHSHLLFGTDSTYRWETWKVLFIQQIKTSAWIHICMNEQLKLQPHSGHKSDRIKNGGITPGSFIKADSPFLNKWAQSRLVPSITQLN